MAHMSTKLKSVALVIPEVRLGRKKIKIGHVTHIRLTSPLGMIYHHRPTLGLVIINLCTKLEVLTTGPQYRQLYSQNEQKAGCDLGGLILKSMLVFDRAHIELSVYL